MKYKYKYEMKQNNIWIPPKKKEFFLPYNFTLELMTKNNVQKYIWFGWRNVEAIRNYKIVENISWIFYTFKVVLKQLHFILF
jgi:hypothetical protein